jgi:hypothetical protein
MSTPKYVQGLLGHASMVQTLDTYSHIIEGLDGGTTDAIEEASEGFRGLSHSPTYAAYLSGI